MFPFHHDSDRLEVFVQEQIVQFPFEKITMLILIVTLLNRVPIGALHLFSSEDWLDREFFFLPFQVLLHMS